MAGDCIHRDRERTISSSVEAAQESRLMNSLIMTTEHLMQKVQYDNEQINGRSLAYGREFRRGKTQALELVVESGQEPVGYVVSGNSLFDDAVTEACCCAYKGGKNIVVHVARCAEDMAIVQWNSEVIGRIVPCPCPERSAQAGWLGRILVGLKNCRIWRHPTEWEIWVGMERYGIMTIPWWYSYDSLQIARFGRTPVPLSLGDKNHFARFIARAGPDWVMVRDGPEMTEVEEALVLAVTVFFRMTVQVMSVFS